MNITLDKKTEEPLYLQIKSIIKEEIKNKKLDVGTKLPNIYQIADSANVCIHTVQKALDALISDGVCYRRPKKGTFVGEPSIVKQKNICLLHHYAGTSFLDDNLYDSMLYRGISEQARDKRIDISLITYSPEETISFYLSSNEFNLKAVFIISMHDLKEGHKLAIKFPSVRFIYLGYKLPDFEETPDNVYGVFFDAFAGSYQMASHLISKGYSKIAIVSKELIYDGYRVRLAGYKQALMDNNIDVDISLIYEDSINAKYSLKDIGYKTAKFMLKSHDDIDAIFCVNDFIATGAVEYLKEKGLEKQIEVAGYDNLVPELSIDNHFSTMSMDFKKIGKKGMDILMKKSSNCPKTIKLIPQIILRGEK